MTKTTDRYILWALLWILGFAFMVLALEVGATHGFSRLAWTTIAFVVSGVIGYFGATD